MTPRNLHRHGGQRGTVLALRVTPRSRRNEITGILSDGTVKIRLTATPVEGKANEALIKFLAEILDVPLSSIEITAGAGGRSKIISVTSTDVETLHKRISDHIR